MPSGRKDFDTAHLGVFAAPDSPLAHVQLRNPGLTPKFDRIRYRPPLIFLRSLPRGKSAVDLLLENRDRSKLQAVQNGKKLTIGAYGDFLSAPAFQVRQSKERN